MSQKTNLHSLRGVSELKYINADNVTRYRAIMRFLYQQYQKLNYWLKPEQIFEGVLSWKVLKNYTFEQCQLDLEQLVEWGNLTSRHYGERAASVEEYLKRKFQYLLTPYSIEIERLLENLESVRGYGGSLEPTLFDTIANSLFKIREHSGIYEPGEALELWNTLNESFQKLHETSVDYIASLQTGKAEELMITDAFLIYKDAITNYLRDFVHALQRRSYKIEGNLAQITDGVRDIFLTFVMEDEWRIPKLEETISRENYYHELIEKWSILNKWFYGERGSISEMQLLERATKEAILKMVRSALRIQEKKRSSISRRKDLEFLGMQFYKMDSLESAHKLAAYAFGLFATRHFHGEDVRDSDSPGVSMWLETPIVKTLRSRSRKRHDRHDIEAAIDNSEEKERLRIEFIKKQKQELQFLKKMVDRKSISVSQIEELSTNARLQLLEWIGRCNASPDFTIQSSEGVQIQLIKPVNKEQANLLCEDGILELTNYEFTFIVVDNTHWENLFQRENKEQQLKD